MNCNKCNNDKFTIRQNGPHHEIRCGRCNAYIKNATKDEIKKYDEIVVSKIYLINIDSLLSLMRYRYNAGVPDNERLELEKAIDQTRKYYN